MRIPELDKRTKQDVIRRIKSLSASYTPEWRFDEENPDVGTALALIYAELFEGTLKRFNQVAEKNMLAFFNTVNARLLPAIPATGYVRFGLSGKPLDGIPVERGTQLVAEARQEGEKNLVFETRNDVLVTPAGIEEIFYVNGTRDTIYKVYDRAAFEAEPWDIPLFGPLGENLQEHTLHICYGEALKIRHGAWIALELTPYRQNAVPTRFLEALLNSETAVWEYYTEEGYRAFDAQRRDEEKLVFLKDETQPGFALLEQFETSGYWLRCTVKNVKLLQDFSIERMMLASWGSGIRPDVINSVGIEQSLNGGFAFGEKMTVFNDLYFGCDEALCKRGAQITLRFNLNFIKIAIDLDVSDPAINWKIVMKKSDFKLDREYDITIEEVLWEYYNGKGWARLFPDHGYGDVFCVQDGRMKRSCALRFTCPEDIERFLLDARESCFIRARILKINNAYKVKGHYISPYLEEVVFDYAYTACPVAPDFINAVNNIEEKAETPSMMGASDFCLTPFQPIAGDGAALYMGFDSAPVGGPIKVLLSLKGTMREKPSRLSWEYLSRRGWRSLNIVDETENLRKTGIVTMLAGRDFKSATLWGRERFWVRIVDVAGRYNGVRRPAQSPVATGIHLNATQIINVETQTAEIFSVEQRRESFCCKLIYNRLYSVEVWVNEFGEINPWQFEDLLRKGLLEPVYNPNGELLETWIKWQEVEDFTAALPDDRFYTVDKNEGIVTFPDGKNGRIPPAQTLNNIRILYSTGGGEAGNLEPGYITRTNRSIGLVNRVTNPEITSGGCDQETINQAVERSAAALKHRYRGVTLRDFERLATEATRNIIQSRCFDNYNDQGQYQPGCVTLVILQKDFSRGRDFFSALQEQVTNYISKRISGNIADLKKFYVIEPQFLELSVSIELTIRDFNHIFAIREQAVRRLNEFLDPVCGNFDGTGWRIGTLPNRTQILNCLKEVPHVAYIRNVFISAYTLDSNGRVEADLDRMEEWLFALPLSGVHEIDFTVEI